MRLSDLIVPTVSIVAFAASAHADISGFGDFSNWTVNVQDGGPAPGVSVSEGWIRLTTQANTERRSIFCDTPQAISQFTASFTYWIENTNDRDHGAAFVIQSSPDGVHAVGGYGSAYGYGANGGFSGISNSVAISLELGNNATYSALYTGGNVNGGGLATAPIDFRNGHPVNVTLTYNGSVLHETIFDPLISATFDTSYFVDIPGAIGGSTAYIGFTGSTDYFNGTSQYFGNVQFSSVPEPAAASLLGLFALAGVRRRQ